MKDLSIVFMGTPEFAVEILKKLYTEGIKISAVVTAPDKPSGRGQKINQSAVKQFAVEHDLTVMQPTNLKEEAFVQSLNSLKADLFVVVAFRMLPEIVWSMPPQGTINLHASLLPNYRGAAPINWAIINGETETGVTTFFIEKEIDTGRIIEQAKININENENVGELYGRLMNLGAYIMYSTVQMILKGDVTSIPQEELILTDLKPAPKIFNKDCRVNFDQPVEKVHNFCRGLSPYPGAWCLLYNKEKNDTKTYKIISTLKTELKSSSKHEIKSSEEGILFPCNDSYLLVTEIQPEGKRKMSFKEFLAGNSIQNLVISDK